MKLCFVIIFSVFIGGVSYSQDNFTRLKDESIQQMTNRYFEYLQKTDTIHSGFYLMHKPLEIKFGLSDEKRVVVLIQRDYATSVFLFSPTQSNEYSIDIFGEIAYGFPQMDEILSVFAYDYDDDGKKELLILGKGGVRDISEEGLTGCCMDIYNCDIFKEVNENGFPEFIPQFVDVNFNSFHSAIEVKTALERYKLNDRIKNISTDESLFAHLKLLDSIDFNAGLPAPRLVIDKIYELLTGENNKKYKVISHIRKTDSTVLYAVGLFGKEAENYFYMESESIPIYNTKSCKVESIFTYNADEYTPNKELIVLLSYTPEGNEDKVFCPLVFEISDVSKNIYHTESWRYGLHIEKNASEIKKAIEYYKEHKYDEDTRD